MLSILLCEVLSADIRSAVFDVAMQSDQAAIVFDDLVQSHDVVTDGAVTSHIHRGQK